MTKRKSDRKQVRPVEQTSINDKRFKRLVSTSKRASLRKVHPLIVLADLRKGSLASLSRYLAQEGAIPDRAIAMELRKLISGSKARSRYRLMVIEHPDRPKSKGGRPATTDAETLDRYRRMVAAYDRALPLVGGKAYLAREEVFKEFQCDEITVKRAIRRIRNEQRKQRMLAQTLQRRDTALQALRDGTKARKG